MHLDLTSVIDNVNTGQNNMLGIVMICHDMLAIERGETPNF